MPTRPIALVPEVGMDPTELARVAAALQKQVTRDLGPVWEVSGTVDAFPRLEDVPAGYWPIIVTFRKLGDEEGIHLDRNGQPYALVELSPGWSLAASHICLELLTNPAGARTFPGPSPRAQQGEVEFLGGVCDPCEHPDFAYVINDVLVSDFCTPAYWDTTSSSRDRLSFTGAVQARHEVLNGGHLSWYDPVENAWWLRRNTEGALGDVKVGIFDPRRGTVREFIRGRVPHLLSTKMTAEAFEARTGTHRQRSLRASTARAFWLRAKLANDPGADKLPLEEMVRASLNMPRALGGGSTAFGDDIVDLADDRGEAKTTVIRASTLEQRVDEVLETSIHVPRPAAGVPPPGRPRSTPPPPFASSALGGSLASREPFAPTVPAAAREPYGSSIPLASQAPFASPSPLPPPAAASPSAPPAQRRSVPPPLPPVTPPPAAAATLQSSGRPSSRPPSSRPPSSTGRVSSLPPTPPGVRVPQSFVLGAVAVTILAGVVATFVGMRVGQRASESAPAATAATEALPAPAPVAIAVAPASVQAAPAASAQVPAAAVASVVAAPPSGSAPPNSAPAPESAAQPSGAAQAPTNATSPAPNGAQTAAPAVVQAPPTNAAPANVPPAPRPPAAAVRPAAAPPSRPAAPRAAERPAATDSIDNLVDGRK